MKFQKVEQVNSGVSFKVLSKTFSFPKQALFFTCMQYKSFENTVGKEEIALNELSHGVFYPFSELSAIFIKFEIVVCKLFHFRRV